MEVVRGMLFLFSRCRHTVCGEGACLEELYNAEARLFGSPPRGLSLLIEGDLAAAVDQQDKFTAGGRLC